jgi:hypothetical protein
MPKVQDGGVGSRPSASDAGGAQALRDVHVLAVPTTKAHVEPIHTFEVLPKHTERVAVAVVRGSEVLKTRFPGSPSVAHGETNARPVHLSLW